MNGYKFFDPAYDDFLKHSGTLGMKWGVRNYQYKDGTWTELGKERRRIGERKYYGHEQPVRILFGVPIYEKDITPMLSFVDTMRGINDPDPSNSNDSRDSKGRYENCVYCALAYELRKRGDLDIKAPSATKGVTVGRLLDLLGKKDVDRFKFNRGRGYSMEAFKVLKNDRRQLKPKEWLSILKDKPFSQKEIFSMENELVKEGNGARGLIFYQYTRKSGAMSGHCINYEVANNTLYSIDCQNVHVVPGLYVPKTTCHLVHIKTNDAIIDVDSVKQFMKTAR